MDDNTSANRGYLHTGAERFHTLLQALRTETERQLDERMADVEAGIDVRDYQQLARMIEESMPLAFDVREGFMRALADLLACFVDRATFDIDEPMRLEPIGGPASPRRKRRAEALGRRPAEAAVVPSGFPVADGRLGGRGNYYSVPTVIVDVPGVVKKAGDYTDFYSGSAEALVVAGLLPAELFPGQPGRNSTSQSYRPLGVERRGSRRNDLECWHRVPGYLRITRRGGGGFQIHLAVSREEQARRAAARESQRAMVAARLADMKQGARTDLSPTGGMSQADAADWPTPMRVKRRAHLRLAWSTAARAMES